MEYEPVYSKKVEEDKTSREQPTGNKCSKIGMPDSPQDQDPEIVKELKNQVEELQNKLSTILSNLKEEENSEETLESAKYHKKWLRFDIGEIVYLKSDINRICPMTISDFLILDEYWDYVCTWTTKKNTCETRSYKDRMLYKTNEQ